MSIEQIETAIYKAANDAGFGIASLTIMDGTIAVATVQGLSFAGSTVAEVAEKIRAYNCKALRHGRRARAVVRKEAAMSAPFDLRRALAPVWSGAAYYASRPLGEPVATDPDGRKRDMASDAEAARWAAERADVLSWLPDGALVYDLGCGDGKLKATRPGLRVYGYDPDAEAQRRALARGCVVSWTDRDMIEPAPLFEGYTDPLDALWCCHVVEHMADPLGDLHAALRCIRHGGLVVVETPDFGSPVALEWGSRFRLLHDPTHISLFTAESLVRMLRALGVEIEEVTFPGYFGTPLQERRDELRRADGISPPAPGNVVAVKGRKR